MGGDGLYGLFSSLLSSLSKEQNSALVFGFELEEGTGRKEGIKVPKLIIGFIFLGPCE